MWRDVPVRVVIIQAIVFIAGMADVGIRAQGAAPIPREKNGGTAPGADYYFDSRRGDNSNSGTSPEKAWKDFARINDKSLLPGDRLLLRRGSHFKQQLRLSAVGTARRPIEITAYGDGPRPVVEGRSTGGCAAITPAGAMDETASCIQIRQAAYLRVSHLTVYNAYFGLLVNNTENRSDIAVDDVIAYNIQNFGQDSPRCNSVGIEVAVGRGHPCENVTVSNVSITNSECCRTGCGFSTKAHGSGSSLRNVRVKKVTAHDNANTPWSYVALFISGVRKGTYEGVCLDRCAPHWKFNGTATVHYVRSDDVVFRNSYIANTQNSDSHDMGAWDFERGGERCLIENTAFVGNAGPAIEFLRCDQTAQNVTIRRCTFLDNDWTFWGYGQVVHIGRSGPDPVGLLEDNHFVLVPGTTLGGGEAPGGGLLAMRNNKVHADASTVPPYLKPPAVDGGSDRTLTGLETTLRGRVSNATTLRWEAIIAPGEVTFGDPRSLVTDVCFSARGTYVLRLAAENDHFLYGDYVTIRCVEDARSEVIAEWPAGRRGAQTVDVGRTFTIDCRVKVSSSAFGPQTILASGGPAPASNGLRLYVNNRGTRDGTVVVETGNGQDWDCAASTAGAFTLDAWHRVVVSLDCTSRDTRGEARIYIDGRDVTAESLIRSDIPGRAMMQVGRMPGEDIGAARSNMMAAPPAGLRAGDEGVVPEGFELAYADDFTGNLIEAGATKVRCSADPIKDHWNVAYGQWQTRDGWLMGRGKSEIVCTERFGGDVLLAYDAFTDDATPCDLSATINATLEHGPMYGYFFGFGTGQNKHSALIKRTGPLGQYPARIVPGKVHRVACLRRGPKLAHFIDGQKVFEYTDKVPLPRGRRPYVSLYTHTGGKFGRVRVYQPRFLREFSACEMAGEIGEIRIFNRVLSGREIAGEMK